MNIQKINWKLSFKNQDIKPFDFFRAFNDWIPDSPEVFVDVADYQHVHDGPKIILVGHFVDYALEENGGVYSFVGAQKKQAEGSNVEKLQNSFQSFAKACSRLKQDSSLKSLEFKQDTLTLIINDRALAPSNQDTFKEIEKDLSTFADQAFGKGKYSLHHVNNPKGRFTVNFKIEGLKL